MYWDGAMRANLADGDEHLGDDGSLALPLRL